MYNFQKVIGKNTKKKYRDTEDFGNSHRPRTLSFKYLVEGQAVGQFTAICSYLKKKYHSDVFELYSNMLQKELNKLNYRVFAITTSDAS